MKSRCQRKELQFAVFANGKAITLHSFTTCYNINCTITLTHPLRIAIALLNTYCSITAREDTQDRRKQLMISAIVTNHFTSWDDIIPARWGLNWMICDAVTDHPFPHKPPLDKSRWRRKWLTVDGCFCCAANTCLSFRSVSSSILHILHHRVIRARGWWMGAERSTFCASSQTCMSRTRSPAAINLAPLASQTCVQ